MAKKYKSLPHEIHAFRFTKKDREFPSWFIKAVETGKASVTINNKTRHITIYGKEQKEVAFENDFVCLSGDGKLYVLEDVIFEKYYSTI